MKDIRFFRFSDCKKWFEDKIRDIITITLFTIKNGSFRMGRKRLAHSFMDTHDWYLLTNEAGSLAGLSEHISMLPLDNVKTHCQAGSHLSLRQIFKSIYDAGGLKNFYSGFSVLAMGCIPAHAIYFSIYEKAKKHLGCENPENHYKFAMVGVASSLFHDVVMTPTEVVKQRLQLMHSSGNMIHTKELIKQMYGREGIISFYRSFGVNYLMNVPFGSMIVFFNEKIKFLLGIKDNDSYFKYFICAGMAGALASIPTCPFDVIKTRLNTQACLTSSCEKKPICDILKKPKGESVQKFSKTEVESIRMSISSEKPVQIKYKSIIDTASIIAKEEGFVGLFSGLKMRIAIQSLSSAISWGIYHVLKSTIESSTNKF